MSKTLTKFVVLAAAGAALLASYGPSRANDLRDFIFLRVRDLPRISVHAAR
jgi:hypothetical protein